MGETVAFECQTKRSKIVALAKRLADEGAHYLWGANGEKPTRDGPVKLLAPALSGTGANVPCFCAAAQGSNVCAGRFRAPGFGTKAPRNKVTATVDADVQRFCDQYDGNPGAQYGWDDRLTPRRIKGYAGADAAGEPTDYGGAGSLLDKIVWGEGCDDTQHFDCGGFVRYVVREVCGTRIDGISQAPAGPRVFGDRPMGTLVEEGSPILGGDILVYKGHIAFALEGNGLYKRGKANRIVQAESAVFGLNYDKTRDGDTKCIRLTPSALLNRRIEDGADTGT